MPSLPCEASLPWPLPLMGIVLPHPARYKIRRTGLTFPTVLRRAVVARASRESHLARNSAQEYTRINDASAGENRPRLLGPMWVGPCLALPLTRGASTLILV